MDLHEVADPRRAAAQPRIVVVGHLARDLVLSVEAAPEAGESVDAHERREMLGGNGGNQAVALAQLGAWVALMAVVGDDRIADDLRDQAHRDRVDVSLVIRRPGVASGMVLELLDADGRWRYVQDISQVSLSRADVDARGPALDAADAVLVQLQQPPEVALAVARRAKAGGALVVLDGVPGDGILAHADVLRADDHETELVTGVPVDDVDGVRDVARGLLDAGPRLVALGVGKAGNLFVWRDPAGELLLPLTDEEAVDTTGGGDAFVAALTVSLARGRSPGDAARLAAAAAGATVARVGGRPDLTEEALADRVERLRRYT